MKSERLYVAIRCGPIGQNGHGGHDATTSSPWSCTSTVSTESKILGHTCTRPCPRPATPIGPRGLTSHHSSKAQSRLRWTKVYFISAQEAVPAAFTGVKMGSPANCGWQAAASRFAASASPATPSRSSTPPREHASVRLRAAATTGDHPCLPSRTHPAMGYLRALAQGCAHACSWQPRTTGGSTAPPWLPSLGHQNS